MRTKTLLLAAAALATGLATSSAQLYSRNVVGYMNVTAPVGFSMIANQLTSANNSVGSLIPNANNGSITYKFVGGYLTANNYFFGWTDPNTTMHPGEGVIFYNPGPGSSTFTFIGEVKQGTLTTPIPAGFSIVSSQIPQAGLISTDIGFPTPTDGDIVYRGGSFTSRCYLFWWCSGEPSLDVGEAVLCYKTVAQSWVRNFVLNDPIDPGIELTLALNPAAQLTLSCPTGAVYRVEATSDLNSTNSWPVLTNITIPFSPFTWTDPEPPTNKMRFYRAVMLP